MGITALVLVEKKEAESMRWTHTRKVLLGLEREAFSRGILLCSLGWALSSPTQCCT